MAPRPGVLLNARKIRDMLDDRGVGVTEFAQQIRVPRQTIWNKLAGQPSSIRIASRIANALGVPRDEILRADDEDEPEAEALASLDTKKARPPTTTGPRAGEKLSRKHNNQ